MGAHGKGLLCTANLHPFAGHPLTRSRGGGVEQDKTESSKARKKCQARDKIHTDKSEERTILGKKKKKAPDDMVGEKGRKGEGVPVVQSSLSLSCRVSHN